MLRRAAETVTRATSELLSDDSVFSLLQRGLSSTLEARKLFERNVVRLLAAINVPSRQDFDLLLERVEALNRQADALARRLDAISARLARKNGAWYDRPGARP